MSTAEAHLRTICFSSLSKVFADEDLVCQPVLKGSILSNKTYSFQVAYYSERFMKSIRVRNVSDLK